MRYAIIDLTLAKDDPGSAAQDLEFQVSQLEARLAALERERSTRFQALNEELYRGRERLKGLEKDLARSYRRLYAEIDEVHADFHSEVARKLFQRLKRCRDALAQLRETRPSIELAFGS